MKLQYIVLFFCLLTVTVTFSQNKMVEMETCTNKVIDHVANHVKFDLIDMVTFKKLIKDNNLDFDQWLEDKSKENLNIYKCYVGDLIYYVAITKSSIATGLAINQWSYFVQIHGKHRGFSFTSLAKNPKSAYFDNNNEVLRYIEFRYSDTFMRFKTEDKIGYKAQYYSILNNKHELLKEIDEVCP